MVKIKIFSTPEEVDLYTADQVIKQIKSKPDSVLTLPTGATQLGWYKLLVNAYKNDHLDLNRIRVFNLDEYYPIKKSNPASYACYMQENLFKHVNIPKNQQHIPSGEAQNPDDEAKTYEWLIQKYQPVDLAILGIGPGHTCHIGFNEKGSNRNSRVRFINLDKETLIANSEFFKDPKTIPTGAITQGIADILEAKKIVLLAKGKEKAWGINRTLNGPISPDAPASFLRLHPNVTFLLDKEATSLINNKNNLF